MPDSEDSLDVPLARLVNRNVDSCSDEEKLWTVTVEQFEATSEPTQIDAEKLSHFLICINEEGNHCNLCSRAIYVTRTLTTLEEDRLYGCDVCPAFFISARDLFDHKCEYHSRSYDYFCRMCRQFLPDPDELAKHVSTHSGNLKDRCALCQNHDVECEKGGGKEKKENRCEYCKKLFASESLLASHLKIHKNEQKFSCSQCGRVFLKSIQLERHIREHERRVLNGNDEIVAPLPTSEIKDDFSESWTDLPVEVEVKIKRFYKKRRKCKKADNGGPYICDKCGKSYMKKDHLRVHMNGHLRPLNCPICKRTFAFKTYLLNHISTHTGEKRFLCHLCGTSFSQYGNLQSHVKRHTGDKRFQCNECSKSFFLRGALKKHIRTHTGEQPFQCSFCSRSFSSSGNMIRHRMIHTGEKPYKCTFCEKAFIQSTELKNHLRTHLGTPRPPRPQSTKKFSCPQCSKSFTSSAYLKTHIRVHTGERPYKCAVCDKTFAKISSYSQHRKIHLSVKPYICSYCGKGFSQSGNFTMHIRKHTGEKPYECQTCGKCFSQPVNLTRHRLVHTGEKKYSCPHCDKRFSQKHALTDHVNIHLRAKPHKCKYCESAFANQSTLSRHLSTHNLSAGNIEVKVPNIEADVVSPYELMTLHSDLITFKNVPVSYHHDLISFKNDPTQ